MTTKFFCQKAIAAYAMSSTFFCAGTLDTRRVMMGNSHPFFN
jgi:hypothetical protein